MRFQKIGLRFVRQAHFRIILARVILSSKIAFIPNFNKIGQKIRESPKIPEENPKMKSDRTHFSQVIFLCKIMSIPNFVKIGQKLRESPKTPEKKPEGVVRSGPFFSQAVFS